MNFEKWAEKDQQYHDHWLHRDRFQSAYDQGRCGLSKP